MRLAVVGAGAWGTSLAHLLAAKGHQVKLWAFEPEVVAQVNAGQENRIYLPGLPLHPALAATASLAEALAGAELVALVTPSHHLRRVAQALAPDLPPGALVVSATKGLEEESLLTMTQVLTQVLGPARLAALSGPSFAAEVARGMPTAVTVASAEEATAKAVQEACRTERFRVYTSPDVLGVELGGALKNVLAIAAGLAEGLGLGRNTLAALITRGLAEMSRLGVRLGADPLTFLGLSGVGDLVLTCTSPQSRNYTIGLELGRGRRLAEALANRRTVAEGVRTSLSAVRLAERVQVDLPIGAAVKAILFDGLDPRRALAELMTRDPKQETWGLPGRW